MIFFINSLFLVRYYGILFDSIINDASRRVNLSILDFLFTFEILKYKLGLKGKSRMDKLTQF